MKRYLVTFVEKVVYEVEIEAESAEEAQLKVEIGDFGVAHPVDSYDLEVQDVEELEE